jgi:hypothetical protein
VIQKNPYASPILLFLLCLSGGCGDSFYFQYGGNQELTIIKFGESGLQWQGCPAGQSGVDCSRGEGETKEYDEAMTYCENLEWSGFSDWRLPNIDELRSLITRCPSTQTEGTCSIRHECSYSANDENTCNSQYCDGCFNFVAPGTEACTLPGVCGWYWSASLHSDFYAYGIEFADGHVGTNGLVISNKVRCVRDQ